MKFLLASVNEIKVSKSNVIKLSRSWLSRPRTKPGPATGDSCVVQPIMINSQVSAVRIPKTNLEFISHNYDLRKCASTLIYTTHVI